MHRYCTRATTVSLVCLIAAIAACQPQAAAPTPAAASSQPIRIVEQFFGEDPGLTTPTVVLIQSRQQLQELGSITLADRDIDFDRHTLLLLALGQRPTGGFWARVTGVQRRGDVLYVQGDANRPGKDQAVTQALTYPYSAALLPKTNATSVRSEIQSVVGQTPPAGR